MHYENNIVIIHWQVGCAILLDIDECADGMNNCKDICRNTNGSYSCDCRSGYSLNNDGYTCSGKSTLMSNYNCVGMHVHIICIEIMFLSTTTNLVTNSSSIQCSIERSIDFQIRFLVITFFIITIIIVTIIIIMKSFRLVMSLLLDFNECANETDNNCTQVCQNKMGSYSCDCNIGYTLDSDGYTCNGKSTIYISSHKFLCYIITP